MPKVQNTMSDADQENQLAAVQAVIDVWEGILQARIRALRSEVSPDQARIQGLQRQLYAAANERRSLALGDARLPEVTARYCVLIAQARQED